MLAAMLRSFQRTGRLSLGDTEPFLAPEDNKSLPQTSQETTLSQRALACHVWLTVFNVTVFCATIVGRSNLVRQFMDPNQCMKDVSAYSPIFDAMTIRLQPRQLNGAIFPGEDPVWSRREIGDPEGEAQWEKFGDIDTFPITREDVIALGKDPETAVKYSEDFGLGDDAYAAGLDAQHKLHCLDSIRKMAFSDYGYNRTHEHVYDQLWWVHLRHCVDMLLQDQLCNADADIITFQWVDTQAKPFPDFGVHRKCGSYDDLIAYRDARRVDKDRFSSMRRPANAKVIPFERQYYAMYGFNDSILYPDGQGFGDLPKDEFFGVPPVDSIAGQHAAHRKDSRP